MQIYSWVGAIALLGGAALYSQWEEGNQFAKAAKRFGLNAAQSNVMRECEQSMSRHERTFKSGADTKLACACIAEGATKGMATDRYALVNDVYDVIVVRSKNSKADINAEIQRRPVLAAAKPAEIQQITGKIFRVAGYCSKPENLSNRAVMNVSIPDSIAKK